ncbi:MAG TPA: response regulator [Chthonomonadaceae bacterium]|nr:response regulator [Chthonomonadaceae bacterium]
MSTSLQVLIVEDSEDDADLTVYELIRGGYDPVYERVETPEAMGEALDRKAWDVILSDYTLPRFSALGAWKMVQVRGLETPFIIVSGTIGEEVAVAALKAGVHDYLMKSHLARLVSAIEREMREAAGRLERKRLENQLLQAQKLESLGRLAGGVAHDFNNLLTIILGYSELALDAEALDASTREFLQNVCYAAEKASGLTRQLLAFARKQIIEPKVLNLNDVLISLDKMMRRLIGEDVELVLLPQEDLYSVKVDPGQFEQILVNLIVNSRDAMPDGGKITVETQNIALDAEYARQHEGVRPGDYVRLTVSDNGTGMDEGVQLHIFEPFFTTKEKGRGTGLGLATVYGIVKQAGGHIWLYSEVGEGTTFKIYLPRVAEAAEALAEITHPAPSLDGTETILIAEDEPLVRDLATQTLRGHGYTVLEAMSGEEALTFAKGRETGIALLISDVVMPRMSGKQLAEQLQVANPSLRVLYASGYTENTIVHHGVLEAGIAFLSKPFTPTALLRKVREVLDSGPSEAFAVPPTMADEKKPT